MSKEIKINLTFSVTNGSYKDNWAASGLTLDQLALGANSGIVATSTSESALPYGAVSAANAGFLLMQNLDSTNACDFGLTGNVIGRMLPGEHAMFRVTPSVNVYLKAVAGTPQVQFWLLQA